MLDGQLHILCPFALRATRNVGVPTNWLLRAPRTKPLSRCNLESKDFKEADLVNTAVAVLHVENVRRLKELLLPKQLPAAHAAF
jgi:hypothetical protein